MNFDIYLISKQKGEWKQFPAYSAEPFFDKKYPAKGNTPVIAVLRKGNMMYYTFMHPLESSDVFGITVAMNSLMATDISMLAKAFAQAWKHIVETGAFVRFEANGGLRMNELDWTQETFLIESFRRWFSRVLESVSGSFSSLPPVNLDSEIGGIEEIVYSEDPKFAEEMLNAYRKQIMTVIHFKNWSDSDSNKSAKAMTLRHQSDKQALGNDLSNAENADLKHILMKQIHPSNFMDPYDAVKVAKSNDIYNRLVKCNPGNLTEIDKLRNEAQNGLGIAIHLVDADSMNELRKLVDPKNFFSPYDAERVALANELFATLQKPDLSYEEYASVKQKSYRLYNKPAASDSSYELDTKRGLLISTITFMLFILFYIIYFVKII